MVSWDGTGDGEMEKCCSGFLVVTVRAKICAIIANETRIKPASASRLKATTATSETNSIRGRTKKRLEINSYVQSKPQPWVQLFSDQARKA